jgi:trans-aconitate methyltransferase
MTAQVFDADYYRRFYGRNGVHNRRQIGHLAAAVHEMCAWWEVAPRSVLDVGAGTGLWRDWYRANHPMVRTGSIDISEHACRTWGHQHRDIASWRPARPFDLVVCHSVLQYLDDREAARAIDNLSAATRYVMYLEVLTTDDLDRVADQERTDMDVHRRTAAWYRRRLEVSFRQAGANLWVRRDVVPLYELEAARP